MKNKEKEKKKGENENKWRKNYKTEYLTKNTIILEG